MGLPENLKYLRKITRLPQREMAEVIGVKLGTYQKWEEGRSEPHICMLVNLAKLHGVTVDKLIE